MIQYYTLEHENHSFETQGPILKEKQVLQYSWQYAKLLIKLEESQNGK